MNDDPRGEAGHKILSHGRFGATNLRLVPVEEGGGIDPDRVAFIETAASKDDFIQDAWEAPTTSS